MDARQWRRAALSLLVSGGFLYLAFRNVPLDQLGDALRHVDMRWVCVAVVISLLIMLFRTWRWQLEVRPLEHVPFGRLWLITAVSYLAINVVPARLGEVVRPWLLSRRSGLSFAQVVGTVVVEKTVDSMVLLFYIFTGLLTIRHLPDWVREGAVIPAVAAVLLVSLVLLLYWRGEDFVRRRVLHYLPERFGYGLQRVLTSIVQGMRIIPQTGLLLTVLVVSLALWFLPILSSYVMILAFDLHVPFSAALVVFIFIGFGTALPNVPAMIGPYQYACVLALGLFHVSEPYGLAYGLVLNAIQFLSLVAQGLVALPLAGVSVADIRRAREAVPAQS